jgi:hypothetical protein
MFEDEVYLVELIKASIREEDLHVLESIPHVVKDWNILIALKVENESIADAVKKLKQEGNEIMYNWCRERLNIT